MGGKRFGKGYTNFIYIAGVLLLIFFQPGCVLLETHTPEKELQEIKFSEASERILHCISAGRFEEALKESEVLTSKFKSVGKDTGGEDLLNRSDIISALILRIIDDSRKNMELAQELERREELISALNLKIDDQKKKLAGLMGAAGKISSLEQERKKLKEQIRSLKEIDLEFEKINSNRGVSSSEGDPRKMEMME